LADIAEQGGDYDEPTFERRIVDLVQRNQSVAMGEFRAGVVVGDLARIASECGLRPPSELTMLSKALLNLDLVAAKLSPDFDPNETIRDHVAEVMQHKVMQAASPANLLSTAMDAKEFAEQLPSRVNKVMDALSRGELTLNVQGIDEQELMRGIQKLANRVTTGVIVAALIIGGAMIMRVDTDVKVFGYSALAVVMLVVAAAAGVWLVVTSLRNDVPHDPGARKRSTRSTSR
jgi:predicted unusual protein kinase regulating ubiquinone biosynthesis (AarF/ABC1/UbiB family)